jgi:hypothetical protein
MRQVPYEHSRTAAGSVTEQTPLGDTTSKVSHCISKHLYSHPLTAAVHHSNR